MDLRGSSQRPTSIMELLRNDGVMAQNKINEISDFPFRPSVQTIIVAINGNKNSKHVIKWTLDNFHSEENTTFKLLHVHLPIVSVPTPLGNLIPITQVREDVAVAYKKEAEWKTTEMLDPYRRMFLQRKVQVDVLNIEAEDIAITIAKEVTKARANKLVIGDSSRGGMFTRKVNGRNFSAKISEIIPSFCIVYAISKGKLASVFQSETNTSIRDDMSDTSSTTSSIGYTLNLLTDQGSFNQGSFNQGSFNQGSFNQGSFIQGSVTPYSRPIIDSKTDSFDRNHTRDQSVDILEGETTLTPRISNSGDVSKKPMIEDQSSFSDQANALEDSSSESQALELEKIRIELRHTRGMYAIAQSETLEATRKLNSLRLEVKEINYEEEKAKDLVKQENVKYEDAKREVDFVRESSQKALQMKEAETKLAHEARDKVTLENTLLGPVQQYKKFTWEEIVSATSSFSENHIIGKGANGTVFKCNLHHTTAAVKILHSREGHSTKQFQQELEVLSRIRHPHLLLLLGACPEQGSLVYEYMESGSLEERLLRRNYKTPPISWFDRVRIAWEIASALVFLHNSKPKPIIHRDLKPANILLNHNLVSKIGDVGLSKMLHSVDTPPTLMYNDTGLVGTLCYIDPEYQRSGLNSPKSDVYAFGIILLQLLTAKPATALTHTVETALINGSIMKVLDSEAGQWPIEEAKELAVLGLGCAELRRRDRPDLKDHVLPTLERLRAAADRARDIAHTNLSGPPSHFICPILKDVMNDPCVASDGYTYDRKSIEKWLGTNDKSPMTNVILPTKHLIPNYTLLSAILEWKSRV